MDAIDIADQEMENDPTIKQKIQDAIDALENEFEARVKRVEAMTLIHEDLVVVDKIDARSMKSFLFMAEKSKEAAIRTSYYGRILKISSVDSFDEIKEAKKAMLKVGDIVTFNPDSGYSLNVIVPKEEPTIWIISVENVLAIDNAFDPKSAVRKTILANIAIDNIKANMRNKAMQEAQRNAKNQNGIIPLSR